MESIPNIYKEKWEENQKWNILIILFQLGEMAEWTKASDC